MTSTRRGFLKGAGLAAGVALAGPATLAAPSPDDAAPSPSLPEAIARLKSRKSEAQPITAASTSAPTTRITTAPIGRR